MFQNLSAIKCTHKGIQYCSKPIDTKYSDSSKKFKILLLQNLIRRDLFVERFAHLNTDEFLLQLVLTFKLNTIF